MPTPSAALGIIESVYYHPGLKWHIDKIHVMNPIRFTSIRRNEVKNKISASKIMKEANGKGASYIDRKKDIEQRATMMLRNVHYVIEAHFEMTIRLTSRIIRVSFRISSRAGCARAKVGISRIWAHASVRHISAFGKAVGFRRFRKHGI